VIDDTFHPESNANCDSVQVANHLPTVTKNKSQKLKTAATYTGINVSHMNSLIVNFHQLTSFQSKK
jgi:hypothetical protein